MAAYLGIDTSNYTTSVAVYIPETGEILQEKKLLPVKNGELGLRQSDAVFHHTRQLPEMIEAVMNRFSGELRAIGVSTRPTQADGSYMPCFLAGMGTARSLASVLRLPLHTFSHQQGHVAAAAFGAEHIDLLDREFLAFHVSGGTTDALLIKPEKNGFTQSISCHQVAHSLDLKAGQLIDRIGVLLGLPFPAGPHLEKLALQALDSLSSTTSLRRLKPKPVLKQFDCSLSGVENQCRKKKEEGAASEEVALFCLLSVLSAVEAMTAALLKEYAGVPILYAGGVMSNSILRSALSDRFSGYFAPPAFSSDNAAGIALLTARETQV